MPFRVKRHGPRKHAVLRQRATSAAHSSNKTDALSLREEGVAFLTYGKGRAASRAAVDDPHRGRVVRLHKHERKHHEQQAHIHCLQR